MAPGQKPIYETWQNNTASSWWKDPGLRKNTLYCAILYLGIYIGGYDGSYLSGLQALQSWNDFFGTPTGNKLGLIGASAYFPAFVTAPFIAWSCDRFGRKQVLFWGSVMTIVGSVIGCAANGIVSSTSLTLRTLRHR